jgi:MYXO-CTERM domain-containing protein
MRFGAYWDYSKNFVLDHNVIYNAYVAIQLTGSYPADNPSGQSSMLIHSNTAIGEGPWSRAIGGWSHAIGGSTLGGSVIVNNVFNVAVFEQANGDKVNHWPDYGQAAVTTHNLVFGREAGGHNSDIAANVDADDRYEESAGFVDGNARDYRLLADSVAVDTGSTASQFTLDGMLLDAPLDPIVGSGPDRGALERGGDGWFKTIGASIADASGGSNSSGGNGGANATGGANGNTSGIAGTNTGASAGNAGAEAGPASEADTADCACRTPGTRRTRPVLPWLAAALVAAASLRRRRRALALPQGTR